MPLTPPTTQYPIFIYFCLIIKTCYFGLDMKRFPSNFFLVIPFV